MKNLPPCHDTVQAITYAMQIRHLEDAVSYAEENHLDDVFDACQNLIQQLKDDFKMKFRDQISTRHAL